MVQKTIKYKLSHVFYISGSALWLWTWNLLTSVPKILAFLFLSIVEHESRGLEPKDVIKLAMSWIEKSSLKEHPVFSKLEEGITWMGFKSLMEKTFYLEPSLNDNLQLLRSLVKGKSEDTRHYLLRAQYVAGKGSIFIFFFLKKLKYGSKFWKDSWNEWNFATETWASNIWEFLREIHYGLVWISWKLSIPGLF